MKLLYLDLSPAYIPFLVQCTKGTGDKVDPTVDNLIIYEEGGGDAVFDSTQVTGSPFDPAKVNAKTGLWGVLVAKSVFTANKFYVALWEMTVDGVTTAMQEIFFACNAAAFKADVSSLATQSSVDTIDGIVDAIKAKTDNLPTDPADESLIIAATDAIKVDTAAIKLKTDNLPSDPADESLIIEATGAIMTRLGTPVASVSGDIAAVKGDTAAILVALDSAGVGARQVTLQLYIGPATVTPIADVDIAVYDATNTNPLRKVRTNASGQALVNLDDGTYKLRLSKAGWTFTAPETVVVSADGTKIVYGTAVEIGTPTSVNTCRVYEWCFKADDSTPMAFVRAKAEIIALPYDYDGKLHMKDVLPTVYDTLTGKLYWDIVYGATVRFSIDKILPEVVKTIPSLTTKRLIEI